MERLNRWVREFWAATWTGWVGVIITAVIVLMCAIAALHT